MLDKYEEIFDRYQKFIKENSQYKDVEVVKTNTNTPSHFPLITCVLSNTTNTDRCTNDKIEYYDAQFYTINIYTKDKVVDNTKVASQRINDELTKLTILFFDRLNMRRTLCRPTPNLDREILRRTIQYQCFVGNARGNIIRR